MDLLQVRKKRVELLLSPLHCTGWDVNLPFYLAVAWDVFPLPVRRPPGFIPLSLFEAEADDESKPSFAISSRTRRTTINPEHLFHSSGRVWSSKSGLGPLAFAPDALEFLIFRIFGVSHSADVPSNDWMCQATWDVERDVQDL